MVEYVTRIGVRAREEAEGLAFSPRDLDWLLLGAVAALVGVGLWAISGITSHDVDGDPNYYLVRQGIFALLGAIAFLVALFVDPELYRRHKWWIYGLMTGGMVFVILVGEAARGSRRWVDLGFFRFQPSEFGKLLFILFLAAFLADRAKKLDEWRTTGAAVGLGLVPILLVFIQPDIGTALVYSIAIVAALFVAGTRWTHLAALGLGVALLVTAVLVVPARRGDPRPQAVPAGALDVIPRSRARSQRYVLQPQSVEDLGGCGRPHRPGRQRLDADQLPVPPRACDRLRLRVLFRAARVRRGRAAARALPPRRLERAADRDARARSRSRRSPPGRSSSPSSSRCSSTSE